MSKAETNRADQLRDALTGQYEDSFYNVCKCGDLKGLHTGDKNRETKKYDCMIHVDGIFADEHNNGADCGCTGYWKDAKASKLTKAGIFTDRLRTQADSFGSN